MKLAVCNPTADANLAAAALSHVASGTLPLWFGGAEDVNAVGEAAFLQSCEIVLLGGGGLELLIRHLIVFLQLHELGQLHAPAAADVGARWSGRAFGERARRQKCLRGRALL